MTPTLVNDVRMEYQYWHNTNYQPTAAQCTFPCVGAGFPSITSMVGSSNFAVGGFYNAPQQRTTRRYEYIDSLVWQKGTHRFKFGTDVTREVNNALWGFCLQSCLSVYSPESTRSLAPTLLANFPTLPTSVTSNADILNLPVSLPTAAIFSGIGIGTPYLPGPYQRGSIKPNTRPRFYVQDTWKLRSNLTVNYGLAYEVELGLFNSNLAKPAYLAPIYGANNLGATQPNLSNFSPSLGVAWGLGKTGKTVIRGGGGIYYDSANFYQKWREEAALGPVGDGRLTVSANVLTNTFPGIINVNQGGAPVPIGAPLPLTSLTNLTLGQYIQIYNAQIPGITAQFGAASVPTSGAYAVTGIDVAKQAVELYPSSFPVPRSYQTSIGVQRDLGHDMYLTADYARRTQVHAQLGELDLNHYSEFINGVRNPVIPVCTAAQAYVPGQECSLGAITGWVPEGRSVYSGLLVKLQKRLSHRYQFVASYAYQSLDTIASLYNLNNYFAGYGDTLPRHNLTVSGSVNLPWGFQLSVVSSILSRNPVTATIPGVDLVGTTGSANPLPEVAYNCFNDGCGKTQLAAAVADFNATYPTAVSGKKTPNGATIPSLILPSDYQFGDPTFTQDFRLTKVLTIKERYTFSVLAEMFNTFNIANLTGYSFVLNTVAATPAAQTFSFGQPTARGGQTFGSAGPRALQVGGRFTF